MKNLRYFSLVKSILCFSAVLLQGVAGVPLPIAETTTDSTKVQTSVLQDGGTTGESLESQVQVVNLE